MIEYIRFFVGVIGFALIVTGACAWLAIFSEWLSRKQEAKEVEEKEYKDLLRDVSILKENFNNFHRTQYLNNTEFNNRLNYIEEKLKDEEANT